jgi:hypothetical protein
MMQGPVLAPGLDPNLVITGIIPIAGMITGVLITGMVVIGPVGRAIGDVIRHIFGMRSGKPDPALSGDVEDLRGKLETMEHQMAELAGRQEFSERMLAQVRKDRALPGGKDVAG